VKKESQFGLAFGVLPLASPGSTGRYARSDG
jgi:hypothetical protein